MGVDPKLILEYYRNPPKNASSPIKEMKVLEKIDENNEIMYFRLKLPMCSDRDNVTHVNVKTMEDDK